ncbi:MAG TPA: SMP-30/gluconolactonase/LRE family protein [Acidimicrobiales bacterium]|nr:SMP-30/gluconolactonase/LRE family protein [Acidimicrobiales bacterium]
MREFTAEVCTTDAYFLGEGCRWDEVRQELYWVSLYDGQFFRARADGARVEIIHRYDLGGDVGAVAPCADRADGWIVAKDTSLFRLRETGELKPLVELDTGDGVRVNDGAADPWGQFWIGTMAHDSSEGRGMLFRYDGASEVTIIKPGVSISNGLGWSPDRRTMYYVDSGPATIYAFDADGNGAVSDERVFARLDADKEGSPDGLCVDAEGAIWVALWGGRSVRRYAPSGEPIAQVAVDSPNPSSCAIGGANGTTLYVTTAREELTEEDLAREPYAGRLFCVDVGVSGLALNAFG